jgi:beta-lactamase class A
MIEVYRSVERGELRLDEPYVVAVDDKAAGSGVLLQLHPGLTLTSEDLVYLTMSISDQLGDEHLGSWGRHGTCVRHHAGAGYDGVHAGPGDYGARGQPGEAAGLAGCAAMVAMLVRQQNPRRIGRYVPEAEGVRWGSKTDGLQGITNDVGFVSGSGGRLILAVFCEGMADLHVGEQCIGEIARAAIRATGVVTPRAPASGSSVAGGRG